MQPFEFNLRTRLVFGTNAVDDVGRMARAEGAKRVLLVTDEGLVRAGHADRVRRSLANAALDVAVFDRVRENPTTLDVDRCVEHAKSSATDFIVALGGGSSMDCAKGCNFLLTNGGKMQDYWGVGKATRAMLPLIAIPTTAGTGSEMQSFALIADEASHQKMACGDPKASARVAILDPSLAVSQPRVVLACAGLDAIAHAVETAVTRKRNAFSRTFSREAFRLAMAAFPVVLERPTDLEAQGRMLLAAAYAGIAIEHSMLGAAHSMANPLTARFGMVHGHAVGVMLPHVVGFNARDDASRREYAALARAGGVVATNGEADPVDALSRRLSHVLESTGLPTTLAEINIVEADLSALSEVAAGQWTAQFNPRTVGTAEFRALFEAAM